MVLLCDVLMVLVIFLVCFLPFVKILLDFMKVFVCLGLVKLGMLGTVTLFEEAMVLFVPLLAFFFQIDVLLT